jgi:TetR/AcrR family transcriptional regulator, transcriptional repressor for nem operon
MSTKQRILESATHLLKKKGYYGWSYDNISKEVGIRKASIHYYFPEKGQLVAAALKEYINTFWQFANDVLASGLTNTEKLQKIIDCYKKDYNSADEICLCTMLSADYKAVSPEMGDLLQNFYKQLEDWIYVVIKSGIQNGEFNPGIDPKGYACIMVNLLQGLLITGKFSESKHAFQISIEQILSMLKKG